MDNAALTTQKTLNFGEGSKSGTGTSPYEACSCIPANPEDSPLTNYLMEQIVELDNLRTAYVRVVSNKGACGIDGMTVEDMYAWCRDHISELIESLMTGRYRPSPVRGVQIPKPGGDKRQLGIPTTVDRMVQQAILQVLTPIFEHQFSDSSYGFRPGRSAHQAINKASEYVKDGYM